MVLVKEHTYRRVEQNRGPHGYSQLIADKGAKAIKWCKRNSLQQMLLGQLEHPHTKIKVTTDFTACTKINSKWIRDITIKDKTLKLIEDSIEECVLP